MEPAGFRNPGDITTLLLRARVEPGPAMDELFRLIYDELRGIARAAVHAGGYARLGINGTAVVNSACARLLGGDRLNAEDRRHFFFLLSRAMQDVLVEEARAARAQKRGGQHHRVELDDVVDSSAAQDVNARLDVIELHKALDELRATDPESAQLIELRYFAGRSLEETAELMGTTVAIVRRNWTYARTWLADRLASMPPES